MGCCWVVTFRGEDAGEGNISGLDTRRSAVPVAPTAVERIKPGLDRSIIYHRTGLTRARVREACRVDVQGSFLIAKAIPTNAPTLLTTGVQSAPNIPVEFTSSSVRSGVPSLTFSPRIVLELSNLSFHSVSTHGSKLPNATPATPQNKRYCQSLRGLMMPSTWKGANCLSSCRCRTKSPYNMPKPNSVTLLNAKLSAVADCVGGTGFDRVR